MFVVVRALREAILLVGASGDIPAAVAKDAARAPRSNIIARGGMDGMDGTDGMDDDIQKGTASPGTSLPIVK